ncbi:MAG TPA: carboxypeptidase-like regulatory domain-containing protein, partial [Vicinamibacterales bacterium]
SFVYLHAGTPFLKKGDMEMTLPKMDVPVNVVEWELFVPDRFRVDHFAGDMFDAGLMATPYMVGGLEPSGAVNTVDMVARIGPLPPARPGQINGRVFDATGAPIPGVTVVVDGAGQRQSVVSDESGAYVVSNVAGGRVTLTGQLQGFKSTRRSVQFDQRGQQVDIMLSVGSFSETVTVTADSPLINAQQSGVTFNARDESNTRNDQRQKKAENEAPSVNVQNLQRRASGVLPVRMEVPRAGTSHRFVKPLVIDEETRVTFRYKRR